MKILSLPKFLLSRTILFLILFFVLGTGYLLLTTNVHAQECETDPGLTQQEAIDKINKCAIEENIFDDKIFNLNQIAGTTDSLYNLLTGLSHLHPETNNVTADSGALRASGQLVAMLYSTPPASGVEYMARKFDQLNPVQPVYAQSDTTGFIALQPVEQLWSVFRNISYVGFVIVFVIMGFMIMFRAHISPQAVATVQDSLPRVIIALILVTFSYALAGLLIDLMFLILNIIIRSLEASGLLTSGNYVFEKNVFGVVFGSWKDVFVRVFESISHLIDDVLDLGFFGDKIISFLGGTVAGLVVGIAILYIMFRIFMMLLTSYAMIIILTMAAPFFFLFQALPGRNGAGAWFKQMASNILVFPTVALMFIFAGIIGGIEGLGGDGASAVQSAEVGIFPLLAGGLDSSVIGGLIGIGILLMTPQAAELVKKTVGAEGPNLSGGAMAGAAAGGAVVGAAASRGGAAAAGYAAKRNPISDRMAVGQMQHQDRLQQRSKTGVWSPAYREAAGLTTGAKTQNKAGENPSG